MKARVKKVAGASALGALSVLELLHLQQANATPVTFTGSTFSNPRGGSVQVVITVDGASGVYRITNISTPLQPTGQNASYASYAIPTLTQEALAAQSATISAVTGASEISAAWKNSLSSAIASAAAAGETVGRASVVAAPTQTSTSTGGTSQPSSGSGQVAAPTATAIPTSVATIPVYYPLNLPPYSGGGGGGGSTNLAPYFSAVSSAINAIASAGSEGRSRAIAAAQSALSQLQSVASQSSGSSDAINAYIANANTQMQYVMSQGNQQMSDFYAKVVAAANQLYADAQAKADKSITDAKAVLATMSPAPGPTVTVTVTATPAPPPILIKPGGVIKKTFTCVKTVAGVKTTRVIKAIVIKCPTGFTLLKK